MTRQTARTSDLDPDLVLRAYAMGVFPMAENRDDPSVFWVEPRQRAILPLGGVRLSRSLRKTVVADRFRVTADAAFDRVIALCAESASDRPDTWINPAIERVFVELHRRGFAHSIECWDGDRLAGGLYGLALGRPSTGRAAGRGEGEGKGGGEEGEKRAVMEGEQGTCRVWMSMDGVRGCSDFFFSSRRRHTRLRRDWSSDVCSSDLRRCRRSVPRGPELGRSLVL